MVTKIRSIGRDLASWSPTASCVSLEARIDSVRNASTTTSQGARRITGSRTLPRRSPRGASSSDHDMKIRSQFSSTAVCKIPSCTLRAKRVTGYKFMPLFAAKRVDHWKRVFLSRASRCPCSTARGSGITTTCNAINSPPTCLARDVANSKASRRSTPFPTGTKIRYLPSAFDRSGLTPNTRMPSRASMRWERP